MLQLIHFSGCFFNDKNKTYYKTLNKVSKAKVVYERLYPTLKAPRLALLISMMQKKVDL